MRALRSTRDAHLRPPLCDVAQWATRGQGTVEFALVTAAFLAIVLAGGVAWRTFSGGILVDHALMAASHHVLSGVGVMADVFSY